MTDAEKDTLSNPPSPDFSALSPELRGGFEALMKVEEMRADATNRRTEVSRLSLEIQERDNQRRADLDRMQLDYAKDTADKRIQTGIKIAYSAMALFAIPLFFVLAMLFFGDDFQRQTAHGILVYGGVGIAGFGVISALRIAVRKLFKPPE